MNSEDSIQQSFDKINKRLDELTRQLKQLEAEQKRSKKLKEPITNIQNRIIGT